MDYANLEKIDVFGEDERHYQEGEEDEEYDDGNQGEHEYYSERARAGSGGGGGGVGGDMMGHVDSLADSSIAGNNLKHSGDDSSAGKLFVGGIAWETSEETFRRYFVKYGEITDSVIMMDKLSGRPRGFGFVTFSDPEVANKVLEEEHVIDGRTVEVKRTVPREDIHGRGVSRTRKIFVGGIPLSFTEDDMKDYFSSYGKIVEYQIMLDRTTGRSRGFGFVTFDNEDAVEKIFSDGQMHELGGKRVEIKKAEPKRPEVDHISDNRVRRGGGGGGVGGGNSKPYGGYNSGGGGESFAGGYGGKMGRGYGGYGGGYAGYGAYGNYGGSFGGNPGLYGYGGYGYGYGFGFGGPMYGGGGGGGYGAGGYVNPVGYGGVAGYGSGRGYGRGGYDGGYSSAAGYSGGKGYGGGGGEGGAYGGKGYGNAGSFNGRFHPYRK